MAGQINEIKINDFLSKQKINPKSLSPEQMKNIKGLAGTEGDRNKLSPAEQKLVAMYLANGEPGVTASISPQNKESQKPAHEVQTDKGGLMGVVDDVCKPIDRVGTIITGAVIGEERAKKPLAQKLTKAFSRGITFALIGFAFGGPIGACIGFLIGFVSGIFSKTDTPTTNPNQPKASEGDNPKPEQNSEGQPKEGAKVPIPGGLNLEKSEKNEKPLIPSQENPTAAKTEKPPVTPTDSTPEKPKPVIEAAEQKVKEATNKLTEARRLAEEAAAKKTAADKAAKEVADKAEAAKKAANAAPADQLLAGAAKKAEDEALAANRKVEEAAKAKVEADKAVVEAEKMFKEATERLNVLRKIPSGVSNIKIPLKNIEKVNYPPPMS